MAKLVSTPYLAKTSSIRLIASGGMDQPTAPTVFFQFVDVEDAGNSYADGGVIQGPIQGHLGHGLTQAGGDGLSAR